MLAQRQQEVGPYFAHAIAATIAVFALPAVLMIGLLLALNDAPPLVLTAGIAVLLSTLISAAGAEVWMRRHPESTVSFGDLMVWSWWRRKRAEERLGQGARMFGADGVATTAVVTHAEKEERLRVLESLNRALEAKDPYTRGHSQRVERHAYRTALAMGLDVEQVEDLRLAAALHDVGKIRVPDKIIRKPGPLTDDEKSIMNEHSEVGAWMMAGVCSPAVVTAVRQHHERFDGKGYPDGVSGSDISLYARIIAVADTFDAITSTRPYRQKKERDFAVDVIRAEAGTQFDPIVVEAFLSGLPSAMPVAAMLAAIPGVKGLARYLAALFRKAGAASLATGAGATGAAVVMAASFVVPTVHDLPVKHLPQHIVAQRAQVRTHESDSVPTATSSVLGVRIDASKPAGGGADGDRRGIGFSSAPGKRKGHEKHQPHGKAQGRDHRQGARKGKRLAKGLGHAPDDPASAAEEHRADPENNGGRGDEVADEAVNEPSSVADDNPGETHEPGETDDGEGRNRGQEQEDKEQGKD